MSPTIRSLVIPISDLDAAKAVYTELLGEPHTDQPYYVGYNVDGFEVGQEIKVDLLVQGSKVDVTAVSRGKGTAGVMKRHNFSGQGASHGNHKHHRAPGSIGACATPGRVFKGTRMAGRMGGDTVTTQNVTVHAVDVEKGLILIKGAVPGPKGGLVVLRSAAKSAAPMVGEAAK